MRPSSTNPTDYDSPRRRNLVDIIQEDFPRTPSPAFSRRQGDEALHSSSRGEFLNHNLEMSNMEDDPRMASVLNAALDIRDELSAPLPRAASTPPSRIFAQMDDDGSGIISGMNNLNLGWVRILIKIFFIHFI